MKFQILVFCLLCVSWSIAQQPSSTEHPAHAALRELRDKMVSALEKMDPDAMLEHLHSNIVFTTMNGDVRQGPQEIKKYFEKMMKGPERIVEKLKVNFQPETLTILYGEDTGVCYGYSEDHYQLTDGMEFNVKARWSCTIVKEKEKWLIANFHYSTNMFDNPVLNKMKSTFFLYGGIALGISLLLGIAIGRGLKQKSTP